MTDSPDDSEHTDDVSTDASKTLATPILSRYKVLGELTDASGVGVLGQNNAGSGTPVGVKGVVPNSTDGYGIDTPHDARTEGVLDTAQTEFVVEADTTATGDARNVIQGHASNSVIDYADGATIGGGGYDDGSTVESNRVLDDYTTVGGGLNNTAGDETFEGTGDHATVAGGDNNTADNQGSTVGGGGFNTASGEGSTVGGGEGNEANQFLATVGGGGSNIAFGQGRPSVEAKTILSTRAGRSSAAVMATPLTAIGQLFRAIERTRQTVSTRLQWVGMQISTGSMGPLCLGIRPRRVSRPRTPTRCVPRCRCTHRRSTLPVPEARRPTPHRSIPRRC